MTDKKLQQKLDDSVVCAIEQSGKEQHLQISAKELRISTTGSLKGDCYLRISASCGSTQTTNTHEEDMTVVRNRRSVGLFLSVITRPFLWVGSSNPVSSIAGPGPKTILPGLKGNG
jgi:hypothetical protein